MADQQFDFTSRSSPLDPADAGLEVAWGVPPAAAVPTQEFNFTGRSAATDPADTLLALTWGTPPAVPVPTQEFNFTSRSSANDPADTLLALTWGTPPAVVTPTQEFNFTSRSSAHDPADTLLALTWGTPPVVVTPTQEFNFTSRRGPHDSADVLLEVSWLEATTITPSGVPPADQSLPIIVGPQSIVLDGVPPADQSLPSILVPVDIYVYIDDTRPPGAGGPTVTVQSSTSQVIAPARPGEALLYSTPKVSLRSTSVFISGLDAEVYAGYGHHTLSHPPGAHTFHMILEGIEPELPGWHKLTRSPP